MAQFEEDCNDLETDLNQTDENEIVQSSGAVEFTEDDYAVPTLKDFKNYEISAIYDGHPMYAEVNVSNDDHVERKSHSTTYMCATNKYYFNSTINNEQRKLSGDVIELQDVEVIENQGKKSRRSVSEDVNEFGNRSSRGSEYDVLQLSRSDSTAPVLDNFIQVEKKRGKYVIRWIVRCFILIFIAALVGIGMTLFYLQKELENQKILTNNMEKNMAKDIKKTKYELLVKLMESNKSLADDMNKIKLTMVQGIEKTKIELMTDANATNKILDQKIMAIKQNMTDDVLKLVSLNGNVIRIVNAHGGVENGMYYIAGRVLVFHKNRWGSVCKDNYFDNDDAEVLCRTGAFKGGVVSDIVQNIKTNSWLRRLRCSGDEKKVQQCYGDSWWLEECNYPDAFIKCYIDATGISMQEN